MKVMLASGEGARHFDMIRALPGVELSEVANTAEALPVAGDIEVFYGFPTPALLAAAPKLRWIQAPSAGVDFLMKFPELVENDILLTNTRGAHGPSIAEHAFALLFTLTRRMDLSLDWKKERHWGQQEAYKILREIKDSTIGIIGFGAIGKAVAKRATAFDMNVIAVNNEPIEGNPDCPDVWSPDRLYDLLAAADVVVIAAPYTKDTHHLIGEKEVRAMKKNAYLIHVSRGGILDEPGVAKAMLGGHLAGAGIDVAEIEPLPADSPLWDVPNLVLTPHLAGASAEKERRCVEIFRDNLIRYSRGETLNNIVNKRLGY